MTRQTLPGSVLHSQGCGWGIIAFLFAPPEPSSACRDCMVSALHDLTETMKGNRNPEENHTFAAQLEPGFLKATHHYHPQTGAQIPSATAMVVLKVWLSPYPTSSGPSHPGIYHDQHCIRSMTLISSCCPGYNFNAKSCFIKSSIDSLVKKAWTQTLPPPLDIGGYILNWILLNPRDTYPLKTFLLNYFDACFVTTCRHVNNLIGRFLSVLCSSNSSFFGAQYI